MEAEHSGELLVQWIETNGRGASDEFRLVQTLYGLGHYDAARSRLAKLRAIDSSNIDYLGTTGILDARTGAAKAAAAIEDSLALRRQAYQFGLPDAYRARLAALRGDRTGAMAALVGIRWGHAYQLWLLIADNDLVPLRGYAPFDRMVRGRE